MQMEQRRVKMLYDPQAEHDACGVGFIATTTDDQSEVLELALTSLKRLAHRGAVASDNATGDGAGILTQIPFELFKAEVERMGGPTLKQAGDLGVGVLFLPREDKGAQARCKAVVETALATEGVPLFGWREVPTNPKALGAWAYQTSPAIFHLLVGRPEVDYAATFERRLYRVRRIAEKAAADQELHELYFASFSSKTIVYKGLLMADQLAAFYKDFSNPTYKTSLAVYHQRYSTNTTPTWKRAQPFRMLAHNGEINTLQGNVNWMGAREAILQSPYWDPIAKELRPIVDRTGSDSAMLDNVLELLALSDRDIRHAVMMLVPEAWEGIPDMDPGRKSFYRFHSALMEPWDGPAALAFSDGRIVGASLDRNGLRPMRYTITKDGLIAAGSETGSAPIHPSRVKKYGKLGPGQMIAVDTVEGRILENNEIKDAICERRPYGEWLGKHMASLSEHTAKAPAEAATPQPVEKTDTGADVHPAALNEDEVHLTQQQLTFGYTSEEVAVVLRPMVENAHEPVGSMGDDTPLAVLSYKARPLFHYFKQRFAEVTNPPIDHLRERLVFSIRTLLGGRSNILTESPEHAHLVELSSPVLLDSELQALRDLGSADPAFRSATLLTHFDISNGPAGLEPAVALLCQQAESAVDHGAHLLILSDRGAVDANWAPIPTLMATGAVHHHLIRMGKRMGVGILVESGEPREIHHIAAILGYGAGAINPYLALATVGQLVTSGPLRQKNLSPVDACKRYRKAIEEGLQKVMSKMGISTLDSYTGAQIFEAIGLNEALIDRCFAGTPSRVEGSGFAEVAEDVLTWHTEAFVTAASELDTYGFYKYKKDGEFHEFSPEAVRTLHKALKINQGALDGQHLDSYETYRKFGKLVNSQPSQLRSLLDFKPDREPIPVDEVESIASITRRFSTGNMSLGALSPEAHETLAIAMNRLGGRAGSGEGGEDARRYGTESNSNLKQVASGRFGVTPAYLASALEIQIKMAQGSKPGEGGQIPGHKVTDYIAKLRHAVPGVALISPPPHHDIYSIEDLAQLIYDLKRANPEAEISVKLVAQSGVGIIAAGVAKGYADIVLISGHSGGTGSSPLNSIKNAGLPWEIGLAEAQQTLLANGLRDRVGLRADGGFKTGRDVMIGALLGADEYSFGTAAMISEGCIMARACHKNTCPVGVATQDPELRKQFPGTPEHVITYLTFIAQEVREILASLGYRSLNEVIGRTDLLQQVRVGHKAADRLDLSPLLAVPEEAKDRVRHRVHTRNPLPPEERIDDRLIALSKAALEEKKPVEIEMPIENVNRTVGATLSWEIARRYGDAGLPEGTIRVNFRGTSGQAFGAFCINGMHMTLVGQANDYVGKGMAGGEIVIRFDPETTIKPHENVICGNTVLYGATAGELYAAGKAGERFAVRNSGALAVIEGVGDHGCEYMTGGTVVVLGRTGYNFGAGMTGGEAFVLDEDGLLERRYNPQLIALAPLSTDDQKRLKKILIKHYERTGSQKASELLRHWDAAVAQFVRVAPVEEVRKIEAANEGAMAAR